jgi:hypothetical protein
MLILLLGACTMWKWAVLPVSEEEHAASIIWAEVTSHNTSHFHTVQVPKGRSTLTMNHHESLKPVILYFTLLSHHG